MKTIKVYSDQNVLEAAKDRIRYVFDTFDAIVVLFSGGKDSLVVLHLCHEIAQERGITQVNVAFKHEELMHQNVLDFVNEYRQLDWIKMRWLCLRANTGVSILGNTVLWEQWSPDKEHLMPIPEYAEVHQDRSYGRESVDMLIVKAYKGKVALMSGIRTDESLVRFRSVIGKIHDNYISTSGSSRASIVKTIYDWSENDVFKYFYDNKIAYAPVYDNELWAGQQLRVSSPLHAQSIANLPKLKAQDPDLYQLIQTHFPDVMAQERYGKQIDKTKLYEKYGKSLNGIKQYVLDYVSTEDQAYCLKVLKQAATLYRNDPAAYPLENILSGFIRGSIQSRHQTGIMPMNASERKKNVATHR